MFPSIQPWVTRWKDTDFVYLEDEGAYALKCWYMSTELLSATSQKPVVQISSSRELQILNYILEIKWSKFVVRWCVISTRLSSARADGKGGPAS
jgi:hypothetical protein